MKKMSDEISMECPLCMEPLEYDDKDFFPCRCGYQVCRFCWSKILNEENGLCPACRKAYNSEQPASFKPRTEKEVKEHIAKSEKIKKTIVVKKGTKSFAPQNQSDSREHLADYRVLQRNLIFVVGLPIRMFNDCEILKSTDYFGKVGKVYKVVINSNHTFPGPQGTTSLSGYVTYIKAEDAFRALLVLKPMEIDGRQLKLSLGTTKYCSQFLKFKKCNKVECMYLHEMGDMQASFTKEDMADGKHTRYEEVLLKEYQERLEQQENEAVLVSVDIVRSSAVDATPTACATVSTVVVSSHSPKGTNCQPSFSCISPNTPAAALLSEQRRQAAAEGKAGPSKLCKAVGQNRIIISTAGTQDLSSTSQQSIGPPLQSSVKSDYCPPASSSTNSCTSVAQYSHLPVGYQQFTKSSSAALPPDSSHSVMQPSSAAANQYQPTTQIAYLQQQHSMQNSIDNAINSSTSHFMQAPVHRPIGSLPPVATPSVVPPPPSSSIPVPLSEHCNGKSSPQSLTWVRGSDEDDLLVLKDLNDSAQIMREQMLNEEFARGNQSYNSIGASAPTNSASQLLNQQRLRSMSNQIGQPPYEHQLSMDEFFGGAGRQMNGGFNPQQQRHPQQHSPAGNIHPPSHRPIRSNSLMDNNCMPPPHQNTSGLVPPGFETNQNNGYSSLDTFQNSMFQQLDQIQHSNQQPDRFSATSHSSSLTSQSAAFSASQNQFFLSLDNNAANQIFRTNKQMNQQYGMAAPHQNGDLYSSFSNTDLSPSIPPHMKWSSEENGGFLQSVNLHSGNGPVLLNNNQNNHNRSQSQNIGPVNGTSAAANFAKQMVQHSDMGYQSLSHNSENEFDNSLWSAMNGDSSMRGRLNSNSTQQQQFSLLHQSMYNNQHSSDPSHLRMAGTSGLRHTPPNSGSMAPAANILWPHHM